jgi:hypothetical protein
MNLTSWLEFAIVVMMMIFWGVAEAIMWNAPIPQRKWWVRTTLVMLYGMMFFSIWHGTDGLVPAGPRPPKSPEIALSCWVSSPKDEVTINFFGIASKPIATMTDASGPFAMDCQYQVMIPHLPGWQFTKEGIEEGDPGIQ